MILGLTCNSATSAPCQSTKNNKCDGNKGNNNGNNSGNNNGNPTNNNNNTTNGVMVIQKFTGKLYLLDDTYDRRLYIEIFKFTF